MWCVKTKRSGRIVCRMRACSSAPRQPLQCMTVSWCLLWCLIPMPFSGTTHLPLTERLCDVLEYLTAALDPVSPTTSRVQSDATSGVLLFSERNLTSPWMFGERSWSFLEKRSLQYFLIISMPATADAYQDRREKLKESESELVTGSVG